MTYHQKHLDIALQLGDKGGEGRAYGNIGNAHNRLGNYQEALTYHQKYLDIALQLGDKGGEGSAYGNIGNAHHSLGNYQEALTYHQKRLDIALQLGDKGGEGRAYSTLVSPFQTWKLPRSVDIPSKTFRYRIAIGR